MVDIFKEFREHSIAEFFKKNRQMLGYSGKIRSLTTVVHEYITNALDACEEAGILPEIYVEIKQLGHEHYKVIVQDNGPGIPKKFVGKVFGKMLAGTKFHRFQQARGQQGIGAAGAVMFSQITTGKPTKVVTGDGEKIYEAHILVDVKKNEPKIVNEREYMDGFRGVRIESELKGVKYQKGEYSPDEYVRRTALANPHAMIIYKMPDGKKVKYERASDVIPAKPRSTKPHPKGVEVDDILSLAHVSKARTVSGFLLNDFVRISSQKIKEIQQLVDFDLKKHPHDLTWQEAEQLVRAFRKIKFIAPPTNVLIPIGEKHLEEAMKNVLKPDFCVVLERPPALYRGGVPFIVEVGLAYGGKAGKKKADGGYEIEIMRFANRAPLLFDAGGCAITKAVNSIEWKRYGLTDNAPLTVIVNFTSVHVPFTSAGKQAIADEEEVVKEIRLALMDGARKLARYLAGVRRERERKHKFKIFEKYMKPVANALAKITGKDEKMIYEKLKEMAAERLAIEGEENEGEDNGGKESS